MTTQTRPGRELTGRHVLIITVSAFAVIIAVNLFMAWRAIATFPGLEVANSYVASQTWDAERKAQEALGWRLASHYDETTASLDLSFTDRGGNPVQLAELTALVGRPTEAAQDQTPTLTFTQGSYRARIDLAPGKWMLKLTGKAQDGTPWQGRVNLYVKAKS